MVKEKLYFITGNKGKLENAKAILPDVEQIDIDVCEIQELDAKKILEEKLREATKVAKGRFFCEDVSFEIKSLNGFPGPLIKWLSKSIGNEGIFDLVRDKDKSATIRLTLAYSDGGKVVFFEEVQEGKIVLPLGDGGFGWAPIFQPLDCDKTYAEMDPEYKMKFGFRGKVLLRLKEYIESNEKR
jgi:XTP/dITP diphosphohydrolase